MKKYIGIIWMLCAVCFFTAKPQTAWWSVIYPQSLCEAGVEESPREEEEKTSQVQIKWKLAEWIAQWF